MSTIILKTLHARDRFTLNLGNEIVLLNIVEDRTVTVEGRTVIEVLILYFTLYPSPMLDSHPFTSMPFPSNNS